MNNSLESQSLYDWLNKETGGLLYWANLIEQIRELKDQCGEDLVNQMRDLNRKKAMLRE